MHLGGSRYVGLQAQKLPFVCKNTVRKFWNNGIPLESLKKFVRCRRPWPRTFVVATIVSSLKSEKFKMDKNELKPIKKNV